MDKFSGFHILRRTFRFLGRIDVAATIIVAVLLLSIIGSWFPQPSPFAKTDPELQARALMAARGRYGPLTDVLSAVGAFHWFSSPLFTASFVLLTVSIVACTLQRWHSVWRRAFQHPFPCSDAAFARAPFHASGSPAEGRTTPSVVRGVLQQHGFHVRSKPLGDLICLRGDRNRLAPLGTLTTHLGVLALFMGIGLSSACAWREVVTVETGARAEVGHGTGLALGIEGFAITHYPDGSAAGYRADVVIEDGGQEAKHGSVRVNGPLTYGDVGLYLRSYAETEAGPTLTLLAVHDPGFSLVILAGLCLLLGMTVTFSFPHCWVRVRVEPGGVLHVAGRGDRRAWNFDHEFRAMVGELELAPHLPARG